jgi:hypothetical protein
MIGLQFIGVVVIYSGVFLLLAVILRIFTKKSHQAVLGTALVGSAALLALLLLVMVVEGWILRPVKPSHSDIIGRYVIDRSISPGKNADWQHRTYTLEITETHAIVRDARTKTVWKYRIEWSQIYNYHWSFADATKRHHIIGNGPTLYRESFGFHYVFYSPLYGNVFFEKE